MIGDSICIQLLNIKGQQASIGILAAPNVLILRDELERHAPAPQVLPTNIPSPPALPPKNSCPPSSLPHHQAT
jgi:hypothetical protein